MGLVTAHALGLGYGNPLVGIFHDRALKVVTRPAKVSTRVRNKSFCSTIVWHMAFQALPLLYRNMHQCVIFQFVGQTRMTRQAQRAYRPIELPCDLASMGIVAVRAFPTLNRTMDVRASRHGLTHAFMARIAIARSGLVQLVVIVAGMLVMTDKTAPFCERFMDRAVFHLIEHALVAVEAYLVWAIEQEFVLTCGMGIMAHHTTSHPDGCVSVHPIKKHFFLLMARVALFLLRKSKLKLVG